MRLTVHIMEPSLLMSFDSMTCFQALGQWNCPCLIRGWIVRMGDDRAPIHISKYIICQREVCIGWVGRALAFL